MRPLMIFGLFFGVVCITLESVDATSFNEDEKTQARKLAESAHQLGQRKIYKLAPQGTTPRDIDEISDAPQQEFTNLFRHAGISHQNEGAHLQADVIDAMLAAESLVSNLKELAKDAAHPFFKWGFEHNHGAILETYYLEPDSVRNICLNLALFIEQTPCTAGGESSISYDEASSITNTLSHLNCIHFTRIYSALNRARTHIKSTKVLEIHCNPRAQFCAQQTGDYVMALGDMESKIIFKNCLELMPELRWVILSESLTKHVGAVMRDALSEHYGPHKIRSIAPYCDKVKSLLTLAK